MTCVVAIVTGHQILMGADSLIQGGSVAWTAGSPKIWKAGAGKFAIGFCGGLDWGEVLRYRVRWPTRTTDLPRRLKDCIQGAVDRAGLDTKDEKFEGEALVCHDGTIYTVDSHLTVITDTTRDYAAIGTADIANGVLHATKGRWGPKQRILAALQASAEHSTTVRQPWVFLQL